jgi:hypothetical protein
LPSSIYSSGSYTLCRISLLAFESSTLICISYFLFSAADIPAVNEFLDDDLRGLRENFPLLPLPIGPARDEKEAETS